MKKISVAKLEAAAKTKSPEYIKAIRAAGKLDGDHILIRDHHLREILTRHYPHRLPEIKHPVTTAPAPKGLGDRVESLLKPLARIIDWLFGTNLQNCRPCRRRKQKLNRIGTTMKRLWQFATLRRAPRHPPAAPSRTTRAVTKCGTC